MFAAYVPTAHTYVHSLFGFLLDKYVLGKMHFPRKPQEKKLRELSLPSPPLDSQFPQHPMSPGQDVAETSERMLELANENMHMKAIYVSLISKYIYIYIFIYCNIPTWGSATVVSI